MLEVVAARYPDTVVFSRHYNDWISRPGSLCRIDADTGLAPGAFGYRLTRFLRSPDAFAQWLEVMELWCSLYLPEWMSATAAGSDALVGR